MARHFASRHVPQALRDNTVISQLPLRAHGAIFYQREKENESNLSRDSTALQRTFGRKALRRKNVLHEGHVNAP